MNLNQACSNILAQLTDLVSQLHEHDFVKPAETLSHSTVGQHLRHTLEFFICFENGFHQGIINYDKRAHDKLIESDKFIALNTIGRIKFFVDTLEEKALRLEVGYDLEKEDFLTIETTATRELVYNIEHAVHHMAIMKIGVREIAPYVILAPDFGIAASTIRYKEATFTPTH
ncbi:hypothetical protein [Chryseolinea lacunae]|uniref:DinB family protein n=1 Tax=Chryseolinea lacunae TaxID=2801331 RepID=A0ABS1KR02_9BACT|nr:hypothetical protein [Chryseolinea lacunae]MBL0741871.1 hypothetical protein [Chryseolinea lacunae]